MTKQLLSLIAVSALVAGVAACTAPERRSDMPPGEYERTSVSTDAYGTRTERSTETDVDVDRYGNRRVVTESKTTKDPEGLFNKTTTYKKRSVIEDNR